MRYGKVEKAKFIERMNRFVAVVRTEQGAKKVHVKNTGRCRELLVPGAAVYLAVSDNPARKTDSDLVAVEKETERGTLLINMDAQEPNDAAEEWLRNGNYVSRDAVIRREVTRGDSRFDFYLEDGERRIYLEVKGVTLEKDGIASFPDAPTERGVKHLEGLIRAAEEGYEAALLFVVQMKGVREVRPNDATHPAFGEALRRAAAAGVRVMAVDCAVTPDGMTADEEIPVRL